jgi:hypothetical protein
VNPRAETADLPATFTGLRSEAAKVRASERFLSRSRGIAVAVFVLFAATFDAGLVQNDGTVYFDFLRRLFGVQTPAAAYQFGSAFWSAPFYLFSQLAALRGGFDHYHAGEIAINVAANAAIVLTLYLGWRILRELDLPRGGIVLLLALFGTPLFFYGALNPSYKHAADTLYATAAFWFVLRSSRADARRRDYAAAGACLALLLATRYANAALAAGVLGMFFVLQLRRAAMWILATGALASVVLFGLPVIRHIPYGLPPPNPSALRIPANDGPVGLAQTSVRVAMGPNVSINPILRTNGISATAPLKMLFTLHRGLFIWTPLTFFATVGFVLLLLRDRRHRAFIATLGVSALALLMIHTLWGSTWDGGGSFSSRFLTALFPFFLVGTAEFVRRFTWPGIAVLSICAGWSLWIGLVDYNGYYNASAKDGVGQIVGNFKSFSGPRVSRYHQPPPYDSLENFGLQIADRISGRWQLYWRLVT